MHFGDWASRLAAVVDLFGLRDFKAFVRGWGAPVAVMSVLYVGIARRYRHQPAAMPCLFVTGVSGVVVGQLVVRSGVAWQPGLGRWALVMTPLIVLTLPLGSARLRHFLDGGASPRRKVAGAVMAPIAVFTALVLAANGSAEVVQTVHSSLTTEAEPVTTAIAVVTSPDDGRSRRFPQEHSRCVGALDPSAPRPDGIGEPMWSRMLLVAASKPEWRLCRVDGIAHGPDGLVAVRVFSAVAGPEGYILARPRGDDVETAFVEPQAGQLYYQQPGGAAMVAWDMPSEPQMCGKDGRLSIFRRADRSISGFSRWSRAIEPTTRGTMAAYFTPASIALPLLSVIEAESRGLPVASGPVTGTGADEAQYFGKLRITASMPAQGTLTADRLAAVC